jgi:hypothetical protein
VFKGPRRGEHRRRTCAPCTRACARTPYAYVRESSSRRRRKRRSAWGRDGGGTTTTTARGWCPQWLRPRRRSRRRGCCSSSSRSTASCRRHSPTAAKAAAGVSSGARTRRSWYASYDSGTTGVVRSNCVGRRFRPAPRLTPVPVLLSPLLFLRAVEQASGGCQECDWRRGFHCSCECGIPYLVHQSFSLLGGIERGDFVEFVVVCRAAGASLGRSSGSRRRRATSSAAATRPSNSPVRVFRDMLISFRIRNVSLWGRIDAAHVLGGNESLHFFFLCMVG